MKILAAIRLVINRIGYERFVHLFLTLLTFNLFAQAHVVKGHLTDMSTHEPLDMAVIEDIASNKKYYTDKDGNFTMNSISDSLRIYCIGYESISVGTLADMPIEITMEKSAIQLKDVTISNGKRLETYKVLTNLDLNMQPVKSAQDLLRLVPGLFIAQHMGGGKAEQIFIRGFDADHGTDINISVDGIPVNMVTHAHGQGYADMHFLIPETVSAYDFGKGPFYTDKGDFATAGFVSYTTKTKLDHNTFKLEAGQFNTYRAVTLLNLLGKGCSERGTNAYIAGEALYSNGPFRLPEHFTRYNLFGKFNTKIGSDNSLTLILSSFKSDWRASGELPDRSIDEGYITDRFGVIDSFQGGRTQRTNVSLKLRSILGDNWAFENQLWYSNYKFDLTSDFTYFYYYPDLGDACRQKETRNITGYNGRLINEQRKGSITITTILGAATRFDNITPIGTMHAHSGQFLSYYQYGDAKEWNANIYLDETIQSGNWLLNIGARVDNFYFYYHNLLSSPLDNNKQRSNINKAIISPNLNIAYTINSITQLYLKAGKGFHSNDARVAVANRGFDVIPAAYGTDLGINWKPFSCLYINAAAWYLYLEQEFTFGQDLSDQVEGPVAPSGKTSRLGIDFSSRCQINQWLFATLNVNFAKPRYIDSSKGNNYIDQAPTFTSTASLDFRLKCGINGGISYRYLHDRPANNDYSLIARGYFISDLAINFTTSRYELGLSVENLFNNVWDESQKVYLSRLKNEAVPIEQVSYTPGTPFFGKLKLSVFF